MDVQIREVNHIVVVELLGELDSTTAPDVQSQILPLAEQNRQIILDLTGTGFMSSAGLRILLLMYRQIANGSGRMVLAGLSEEIKDTMHITGFLDFFKIYDNVELALQALQTS
jgi:anti-sigma B factor antagonist